MGASATGSGADCWGGVSAAGWTGCCPCAGLRLKTCPNASPDKMTVSRIASVASRIFHLLVTSSTKPLLEMYAFGFFSSLSTSSLPLGVCSFSQTNFLVDIS